MRSNSTAIEPANWVEFMDIYLIDGTYELFRYFYAVPSAKDTCGPKHALRPLTILASLSSSRWRFVSVV
jgi:hypothetical protein